jgi:DNA-binding beta-propeller fold protein YncE
MNRFTRRVSTLSVTMAALFIVAAVAFPNLLQAGPGGKSARFVKSISVPGRFRLTRPFVDYMTVSSQTLYAAYTSHDLVAAVDMRTNEVVASIGRLGTVHGVAIDAGRKLGFASDSKRDVVVVFDLIEHKVLDRIEISSKGPDAILYDQKADLVYVANRKGASGTLIDPATRSIVATIALGGAPEFCRADPQTGLIYQNLTDVDEIVVIDPGKRSITSRFKLPRGQSPTGLAFDAVNHRLFVSGSRGKLVIIDADNGANIAALPIGSESDGVDYDPGLRRAYTANGFGSMTVIQQDAPDRYRVIENMKTRFGGHSVTVDPATHRIYVASFGSILVYDAVPNAPQ